jgi:hypothetical protein
LDEAREEYESAVAVNGRDVDAHLKLALVLERLGRPSEARVEFQKVLDLLGPGASDDERSHVARRKLQGANPGGSQDPGTSGSP